METRHIPAIFEAGTLRPLVPLDLREHERVELTVLRAGEQSDDDYLPRLISAAGGGVTLEQVQQALAKIPGSLADDFARERDERF